MQTDEDGKKVDIGLVQVRRSTLYLTEKSGQVSGSQNVTEVLVLITQCNSYPAAAATTSAAATHAAATTSHATATTAL